MCVYLYIWFYFNYVYGYVYLKTGVCWGQRCQIPLPGTAVSGNSEPLDMGAGDQTWVLRKTVCGVQIYAYIISTYTYTHI